MINKYTTKKNLKKYYLFNLKKYCVHTHKNIFFAQYTKGKNKVDNVIYYNK